MLRYFSGSLPKPEERLLLEIQESDEDYAALLQTIQKYPRDVIRKCSDEEGHSVLQLVLLQRCRDRPARQNASASTDSLAVTTSVSATISESFEESSEEALNDSATRGALPKRTWSLRPSPRPLNHPDSNGNQEALQELLHYLIHCLYPEIDRDEEFVDNLIDDNLALPQPATRYNSLVRLPARKSGNLPLHTACGSQKSLLEAVQFIASAYPVALKCPNTQAGNLPLHEAAGHVAPLSVLKFLVKKYPEAVRIPNEDGNLPLHLAAAAETYKEEGPIVVLPGLHECSSCSNSSSSGGGGSINTKTMGGRRKSLDEDGTDSSSRSLVLSSPTRQRRRCKSNDEMKVSPVKGPIRRISLRRNNNTAATQLPPPQSPSKTTVTVSSSFSFSPTMGPSRGVARQKSGPPPLEAFQFKPLSQAAVEQREVVQFLVACWPESVLETNRADQTAEQCATASAVTRFLQQYQLQLPQSQDKTSSCEPQASEKGDLVAKKEQFSSFRSHSSTSSTAADHSSPKKEAHMTTRESPVDSGAEAQKKETPVEQASPECTVIG